MAVEEMLARMRRDLEERYGVDGAAYLMDRPRGGWDTLVTNEVLDLKLDVMRHELRAEMAALRGELTATVERQLREQTWRLAALVIAAFGIFATLVRFL